MLIFLDLEMFQLLWTQLNICECVLVYVVVWMHNDSFKQWTRKDCWIQRIVLIITMTMTVILGSVFPFNILIDNYYDSGTYRTYWCSSTYVTMTLTLLNLDCLALESLFFLWLIFLDGSKTRKLQIIWLSYGIISGNLVSSGINFLNPNSLSQKVTKMSKKPSMTLLLWQSVSSSVLCLILWNFF